MAVQCWRWPTETEDCERNDRDAERGRARRVYQDGETSIRRHDGFVLYAFPSFTISHLVLCFSDVTQHVRIPLEYVGHLTSTRTRLQPGLTRTVGTLSLALLLPEPTSSLGPVKRMRLAFYFLSLATIIFRSELSLLIGAQALYILIRSPTLTTKLSLIKTAMLPSVIPGVVISLLLTVGIDTYFWQSPTYLWPELSAFLFNILPPQGSGGASDWGTSPWYWYLTNALPRLMMFQYPLLLLCAVNLTDRVVKDLLTPNLLFVLLYSNLPHKETRFLFSIVPPFTLLAALIATKYYNGSSKSLVAKSIVAFSIAGTLITSVFSHAVLLPLSAQNYPGGHALRALHEYHHAHHGLSRVSETDMDYTIQPRIQVYMTNLALQSGVTRFLEQPVLASSAVTSQVQPDASPKQYEMIKGKVMEVPQHAYQAPRHNTRPSKFEPLTVQVAPGQEPLTIYPQDPQASASPFVQDNIQQRMTGGSGGGSEGCVWIYDKSYTPSPGVNSTAQLERFWSAFSYAVVESPCPLLAADLPFTIAGTIYALDSLKLYRPHELRQASGPSLLQAMYGQRVGNLLSSLSTTVHDTLRYRVLRGYWLEFSYVPKLYIVDFAANQPWEHTQITKTRLSMLCSSSSSSHTHLTNTNDSAKNDPNKDSEDLESLGPLGLPADSHTSYSGPDSNLDALGPLVVNKDGSLSRLDNWTSMTEQERQKLLAFLRKRNKLRVNG